VYLTDFLCNLLKKIVWDHRRICGPSLTETSLCGVYLYCCHLQSRDRSAEVNVMRVVFACSIVYISLTNVNYVTKQETINSQRWTGPFCDIHTFAVLFDINMGFVSVNWQYYRRHIRCWRQRYRRKGARGRFLCVRNLLRCFYSPDSCLDDSLLAETHSDEQSSSGRF